MFSFKTYCGLKLPFSTWILGWSFHTYGLLLYDPSNGSLAATQKSEYEMIHFCFGKIYRYCSVRHGDTQETEAEGQQQVWCQPELYCEFQTHQGYLVRPCYKTTHCYALNICVPSPNSSIGINTQIDSIGSQGLWDLIQPWEEFSRM